MKGEQVTGRCPITHGDQTAQGHSVMVWWPNALNLNILYHYDSETDPLGRDSDYGEALKTLDVEVLKNDLQQLMADSQAWWPVARGIYVGMFA